MRAIELLSAAAALVSALITLAVLGGADRGLLVIPLILCFAVVGWQMVTFFIGRSIQRKQSQAADEGRPAIPMTRAGARSVLNAADTRDLIPPPGVTESTTELLDPIPAKKGGRE